MGVIKFFSSSSGDKGKSSSMLGRSSWSSLDKNINLQPDFKALPNPNPKNYTILRNRVIGRRLLLEIQYHDCTNYEGKKILIFECTLVDLIKQKLIDPHFCENKDYFSPIARFEPTEEGWENACLLAHNLK